LAKKKLTIWLDEEAADRLKQMASVEGLTVSEFGAALLTKGVTSWADSAVMDMAGARIEATVKREVGAMSDRLANLMVRGALEATATRGMVFNYLMQQAQATSSPEKPGEVQARQEGVKKANSQAWTYAVDRLRSPVAAVRELLTPERPTEQADDQGDGSKSN